MRRPPLDIALPLTLLVPPARAPRLQRRVDTTSCGWPEGDAGADPCDARGSDDDAGGPPSRMTTGSGSHMAAHLAKWWKTKFLNGYKQFTVVPTECSDGRASDTEELLARPPEAGCDQPPQQPPPQPPPPHQPPSPSHPLAFEEFECDVSVEGGLDAGGQERQEFSFTLYDFDGHGKITKDDIAGLVTTIYETLGSSIKVPHYGSKTIKVKLTVSPDQRKSAEQQQQQPSQSQAQPQASGRKLKRDLNVTIRESRQAGPATRRKRAEAAAAGPPHSCSSGSATAPASENNDDGAADVSEDDDEDEGDGARHHSSPRVALDGARLRNRRYQQHVASRFRQQHSTYCTDSSVLRQRTKKRSGSLQREELLQIIQANMDKNNLGFQTSRKQCDRGGLVDIRHAHHRHRHKSSHREEVQLHYLAHSPPNCYLDLAGLEHKLQHCHHECRHGVEKSVQHLQHGRQGCHTRGHHRSRSHDLGRSVPVAPVGASPNRYPTAAHLPPTRVCAAADDITSSPFRFGRARSKSHEDPGPDRRKLPPFVMGHTSSPHHLKHRNREQDQARAMAQVVRWLEQEFSSGLGTADRFASGNSTQPPPPPPPEGPPPGKPETGNNSTAAGVSSVERHEHHHVHEHIHHHYHHYRETPVLV